jgi:hypothetical protein
MRTEQREGRGMSNVRRGARQELPEGNEERSNEDWRFTDKWGDEIIHG